MDGTKGIRRDNMKTKIINRHREKDVVEGLYQPRPDEARHIEEGGACANGWLRID